MDNKKQIQIGAVVSYVSIALNIIAGLLYTPWMVERIGQGDYGLYTLSNSLIVLFLVDFGLSSATSRYVAKYRAEGNQEKINDFLGAIYRLYLIIDALIFTVLLVLFFFLDEIYVKLTVEELERFKVVYVITALFSVVNFPFVTLNGILTAFERFIHLKVADIVYRIFLVGVTVAALLAGFGLYTLVAVHALAGLLATVYKLVVIKKHIPIKPNMKFQDRELYREIFSFSFWLTVATLAQRLVFNITPSILGVVGSSAAIAVFGIVVTIEGYSYTITSAINGFFLPKVSRIYAQTDADSSVMPLLLGVGRYQYAINGLIVAAFAVVGKQFILLWMGEDYQLAYWGLLLVLVPGLFYNSLEIANTAIVVQKKVHLQAYVNITVGVLNVLLSIPLSKMFGVLGACASIFVAYTVRAVIAHILYAKVLKLDILQFAKKCYFKMGVPVVGTIVVGLAINTAMPAGGWSLLIVKGLLTVLVYVILVFFIGIDKREQTNIMNWIGKCF